MLLNFNTIYATPQESLKEENIIIQLRENNKAIVSIEGDSFEIDYMMYDDKVLVGNGENNGVAKLLYFAHKINGNTYDLYIRDRIYETIWTYSHLKSNRPDLSLGYTNTYSVVLDEYKSLVPGYTSFDAIVDQQSIERYKTIELYPGTIINNGSGFDTFSGSGVPSPHLFLNEGKHEYYLPLRYIFEELGFEVNYIEDNKTIEMIYSVDNGNKTTK